jgi:hypothetical protein
VTNRAARSPGWFECSWAGPRASSDAPSLTHTAEVRHLAADVVGLKTDRPLAVSAQGPRPSGDDQDGFVELPRPGVDPSD